MSQHLPLTGGDLTRLHSKLALIKKLAPDWFLAVPALSLGVFVVLCLDEGQFRCGTHVRIPRKVVSLGVVNCFWKTLYF